MNKFYRNAVVAVLMLLGAWTTASADFRVGVGTDDFYFSVGKYDYYPYGMPYGNRPSVSFYDVMSDYGTWVSVNSFGRVWRPRADYRWRPYLYGHWTYTQYGQTWQGYEPWAWVGYHYGNWIWTANFGWVWVPGYDWHPGRVSWSHGQQEIGWMPTPPVGYDYCGGSLHYHGGYNQFTYNDPDYGYYDDDYYDDDYYDNDHYGYNNGYYGSSYDSRYRQLYGSPSYTNISVNLWVFINKNHYGHDNYGDYYLDRNHTRDLFTKRAVRVTSSPFERKQLERIVRQRVQEVPVEVREVQTERKAVKVVLPKGEEERIRKNAGRVVKDVIAPAYEKERRAFKSSSDTEKAVERIFKQSPAKSQAVRFENNDDDRKKQEIRRPENNNVEKRPSYPDFRRDTPTVPRSETQREQEFRREAPSSVKTPSQRQEELRREAPKSYSSERPRYEPPVVRKAPEPERPRYEPPVVRKAPEPQPRWKVEEDRKTEGRYERAEPDRRPTSQDSRELNIEDYRRPQPQNDPRREVVIERDDRQDTRDREVKKESDRERDKQVEVKKEQDRKEKSKKNQKDDDRDNRNKKH